jgi:hypothetical protein
LWWPVYNNKRPTPKVRNSTSGTTKTPPPKLYQTELFDIVIAPTQDVTPQKRATGRFLEDTQKIIVERPRSSGNLIEDNRRKQLHASMTSICKWCMEKPDHIP